MIGIGFIADGKRGRVTRAASINGSPLGDARPSLALAGCGKSTMRGVSRSQSFARTAVEQFLKLLQKKFAACQLGELLLLFDYRTVFVADTAHGVKVARMHRLAQDARVEEAGDVDRGDFRGQAFDQPQPPLQPFIREHVENEQLIELSDYPINPSGP